MAEHITVRKAGGTWVVRGGGAILAESGDALELLEGDRERVIFFPPEAVATAFLEPSETRTSSPRLGEATHWSLQTKSVLIPDAAWSYESPEEEFAALAGHVAFHPGKVTVEEI